MKLNNSSYCPDCEEIFDCSMAPFGEIRSCPSCTNRSVIPLYMIIFMRLNATKKADARGVANPEYQGSA